MKRFRSICLIGWASIVAMSFGLHIPIILIVFLAVIFALLFAIVHSHIA